VDKLRQSLRSKEHQIIGFLLVDLVLLGPYLQSGFDSRPGHNLGSREATNSSTSHTSAQELAAGSGVERKRMITSWHR
jgi:hypothetical protein